MKKFIIAMVLMVIVAGCLGIYFAAVKTRPVSEVKLTLLTEEYPPITYREKDGRISGLATEIVTEIMKRLEVRNYDLALLPWDEAYAQAKTNPNTILFSTERTAERETLFNWVGPLGRNRTYFYVHRDSDLKIGDLAQAKKVPKIATCSSWFTEQYLRDQGFTNLQSFTDPQEDVRQLIDRKADLSVFTDMTVSNLVQDAGYSPDEIKSLYQILETEFYIAVSKGTDPKIAADWQDAFDEIKHDGTLQRIYKKYVPDIEVPK